MVYGNRDKYTELRESLNALRDKDEDPIIIDDSYKLKPTQFDVIKLSKIFSQKVKHIIGHSEKNGESTSDGFEITFNNIVLENENMDCNSSCLNDIWDANETMANSIDEFLGMEDWKVCDSYIETLWNESWNLSDLTKYLSK